MTAPVADSLIRGIFQRPVAGLHRTNLSTQHLHSFHIDMLAFYIQCSLIHHTRHVHQCTDGSCCHAMLSCTGFSNDTLLAHLLCQQNLSDGVVNLMGTSMVQVFSFQVELTTIALAHSAGEIQR